MGNNWTAEHRQRQSEAIHRWQPWKKSTGPKTKEGKRRSAKNAYAGGHWKAEREMRKALNAAMRNQQRELLRIRGQQDD